MEAGEKEGGGGGGVIDNAIHDNLAQFVKVRRAGEWQDSIAS